jgi:6-phosphogluconolactonase
LLYVGSYTDIRAYDAGSLAPLTATAAVSAPSFLAAHPRAPVLYAVSELPEGSVSSLAIEPSGALRPLSRQPSGGASPCHLTIDRRGNHLLCANYGGGVALFAVAAGGSLAGPPVDLVRHEGAASHPHHVSWRGDQATVVDLGTDTLYGYMIESARLRRTWVAHARPGAGPRHLAAHPSGHRYVADELSSTVSTYAQEPDGGLRLTATVSATLVTPADRNYPAEIAVSGDGHFVYVANRGNDSITTFGVTADGLRAVDEVPTGGAWPRHFALAGARMYVANQRSDSVTVLRVDDGVPRPTGARIEAASPSCVLVV